MLVNNSINPDKSRISLAFIIIFIVLFSINIFAQFGYTKSLNSFSVTFPTSDKPQSKVWMAPDGKWRCVMPTSSESSDGAWLFKLNNITWEPIVRIGPNTNSHADCKVYGNITYVLIVHSSTADLYKLTYLSGKYSSTLLAPSISNNVDETATIDIDGVGRMWLAYDAPNSDINVRWSSDPYTSWPSEKTLYNTGNDDDICAVTAFDGKIGVLWSNQSNYRFQFSYHPDSGPDPSVWTPTVTAASGTNLADDHINFAVHSNGNIYAAVKTTSGNPDIGLLVRNSSTGNWANIYTVDASTGTRPIVLLNETGGLITVVYTNSDGTTLADIVCRQSPISSILFGSIQTLIPGSYNNATSTKQNYTDEVVILAYSGVSTKLAVGVTAYTDDPTPVELAFFSGVLNGNKIELRWRTETEVNNYGFNIEKEIDNNGWSTTGFVEGHGNSNSPKEYSFNDSNMDQTGKYSYRLKQIDNDGAFEYSDVVTVDIGTPEKYYLSQNYPNPFNPTTRIDFSLPERQMVSLRVYNTLGEVVSELVNEIREPGSYSVTFDASNMSSGIYFYQLTAGSFSEKKKMILLK